MIAPPGTLAVLLVSMAASMVLRMSDVRRDLAAPPAHPAATPQADTDVST